VIYNNLAGLNNIISSEEALNYYDKALKARIELGDKVSVCMIYNNIGAVYMNDKKYSKAIEYLNKGLTVANEIDSKQNLLNIYHALAGSYRKSNRLEEAYSMLFKYASLKDSLFNKESIEKIEEIQTKYETEKKEQEIVLLNNTNALKELEINKNKIEISKQNQEKVIIALALLFFIGISLVVFRSYRITKKSKEIITLQKKEIELQKNEVDEKQKEIVDSINYAKRIQYALLASEDMLANNLNEHFVLFKPKDIVSGDFYWATNKNDKFYLAVCDSTGHGVPGAFMSLLNIGFLSEAINEKGIVEPNKIFDYVRSRLIESIGKEEQQDGMDGILICFDKQANTISYAAANSAPILVSRNNLEKEFKELQKDKMPVGKGGKNLEFNLYHIQAQKNDMIYLYTDGYADQFGGEKGKKFKYKQLNELLIESSSLELNDQSTLLNQKFVNWKGNLEQVDDMCVIGIRI
jgi:serine phosphatase RsbU (regulator of sigma subunit)